LAEGVSSIDGNDATPLVVFVLSLIVRSPEKVRFLLQHASEELKRNMTIQDRKMLEELGHAAEAYGFPSLEAYAEQVHPGYIENSGRAVMTDIIADERYIKRLLALHFWTANFVNTSVFPIVTTDRALTVIGTGLDDPNVMLILPLSPQIVLYLTTPGTQRQLIDQGIGVLGLRTMQSVLSNARRFAYGTRGSNRNLIERHLPLKHQDR